MGTLNGLHETKRFENGTKRFVAETKRFENGTKYVSGTELFVFLGRNALYALAPFSIFSVIHISSHGKSAFCLSSLRQNEKKSLSDLIRSTCSFVIFFEL